MTAPRVIPGYYYDAEKKRHFKIEKHAVPGTAQAKYTRENVGKAQKNATAQLHVKRKREKAEKETIVRPHTRERWGLQMVTLDREIGTRRRSYYVHGVWPDACVSGMSKMRKVRHVVEQPAHGIIRFFDRDPHTKTLYAVHGDNAIRRRRKTPPDGIPLPTADLDVDDNPASLPDGMPFGPSAAETLNEYSFEPWDMLARLTSSISSLIYLPASGALAATTLGSDRPAVVYLSDPDIDGPYVNQQFTPKNCGTIWGAAAPPCAYSPDSIPQSGTESLAVAASSSLRLFNRSPAGDWDSSLALQTETDVLALDWLSPTTVVFGKRNGGIGLYDTRSRGSSHMMTHPFPITKLKRADDPTRLVCAGLQDSLFLYDIRSRNTFSRSEPGHYSDRFFNTQYPGPHNQKKRKTTKNTTAINWSQPILAFPHSNADDMYLDIAVQPELGLVAAAQDINSSVAIKIYNMWTGKLLKEIPRESAVKVHIRCLKFMQNNNGDPELWSTWGGSVVKMSLV
ncbi:hypothetical protein BU23DRAFT_523792 [Bimuria novae-zelandiae CBS 107.79]|uniref:WD40 repeat-like protein n=1 Tax=Bimuria novae-zelandiae CBS 107.79 TaxID=1447943 RepID=A0A6A5W1C0_9PLEO|nr:hypothetical protein BU23DRAFT_523792 [Bimuria novae-zelandiae CBS 107.79]